MHDLRAHKGILQKHAKTGLFDVWGTDNEILIFRSNQLAVNAEYLTKCQQYKCEIPS